jgi:hypothetical protein
LFKAADNLRAPEQREIQTGNPTPYAIRQTNAPAKRKSTNKQNSKIAKKQTHALATHKTSNKQTHTQVNM